MAGWTADCPVYLDLAAPAYGIGSCWAGYFQYACEGWNHCGMPGAAEGDQRSTPCYWEDRGPLSASPKRNFANVSWR